MKSMTGYGRGCASRGTQQMTVEISAVNSRKNLDMRFSIPRDAGMIEPQLRQRIQSRLTRGSIQVILNFRDENPEIPCTVKRDVALAVARELQTLAELTGTQPPTIHDILSMPGVVESSRSGENDQLRELALEALELALDSLEEFRLAEGARLKGDLISRGSLIRDCVEEIAAAEDEVLAAFKERLRQRLTALGAEIQEDDERFAKELCYYADKADITEEVVRLKSHLLKYFQLLESEGDPGRELDFLSQEMSREMNTLSAKTVDLSVSQKAMVMKIELSKIREQIMNIE